MFHYKDGLYFDRMENGDVHLIKREDAHPLSKIILDTVISVDGWASIVSSVSKLGEDHYRYYIAKSFHNEEVPANIDPSKRIIQVNVE